MSQIEPSVIFMTNISGKLKVLTSVLKTLPKETIQAFINANPSSCRAQDTLLNLHTYLSRIITPAICKAHNCQKLTGSPIHYCCIHSEEGYKINDIDIAI